MAIVSAVVLMTAGVMAMILARGMIDVFSVRGHG